MPAINKPIVRPSGDAMELLETAAMTNGRYVRARIVFGATGFRVPPHFHVLQEESFEVISGTLTYWLDGTKHTAAAGVTVKLPPNVPHQHYSEGPANTETIMTMSPAGDFDYVLETLFGLAQEERLDGFRYVLQGIVMQRRMNTPVFLAALPASIQRAICFAVAPVAELFGYRAVYRRFSGEEW